MTTEYQSSLIAFLESIRNLQPKQKGYVYRGAADFLLQHAIWYDISPYPKTTARGAPKSCYGNSILYSATNGWRYVEGYAIAGTRKHYWPVQHAWNIDDSGKLIDTTWLNTGLAYYGCEFSLERADSATWEGDATVLDDYRRGHPILKTQWLGETQENAVPASKRVILMRANKWGDLMKLMDKEGA